MDVYRDLLPLDMFESMRMSEFIFLTLDNIEEETCCFLMRLFLKVKQIVIQLYMFYSIVNELGQTILTNE